MTTETGIQIFDPAGARGAGGGSRKSLRTAPLVDLVPAGTCKILCLSIRSRT